MPQNNLCCSTDDRSGWHNVSWSELGSSSSELLASTAAWVGAVEVSIKRQMLKNPINVTFSTFF